MIYIVVIGIIALLGIFYIKYRTTQALYKIIDKEPQKIIELEKKILEQEKKVGEYEKEYEAFLADYDKYFNQYKQSSGGDDNKPK